MSAEFILNAEPRNDLGKGASRRLRQTGKVPAIIYGSGQEPTPILLDHNELAHQVANEAFFSHILTIKLGGKKESAVVKDLQRHPSRPFIMHMDLQRVSATDKIRVHVPVHFINEAGAPGVRAGGLVTHMITELEIQCLPGNLPEYLEADLSGLEMDGIFHLSDLKLPSGVEIVELTHGEGHDQAVASIHVTRGGKEAEASGEEGSEG